MPDSNDGTPPVKPDLQVATDELTAKERRALAQFFGVVGGLLIAWIAAELTIRVTPYPDVVHVAIAALGGAAGFLGMRWRVSVPRQEGEP